MVSTQTWVKAIVGGAALCIGGPALVMYVTPTEEEIFKRYNPELQKKALANREKRQQEFDEFTTHLKEMSKSDKPIWIAQKEWDAKRAEEAAKAKRDDYDAYIAEQRRQQAAVRGSAQ